MKTLYLDTASEKRATVSRNTQPATENGRLHSGAVSGYFERFSAFTKNQQPNAFAWLALAFCVQGCIISPLTIACIALNGNVFVLYIPCLFAFCFTEVALLASLPTKITIPIFFGGVAVDIAVIIASFLIH